MSEKSIIKYNIVEKSTGRVVKTLKNKKSASKSVDKLDLSYGCYNYKIVPVYQ